jgi:hypothetical protein
MQARLPTTERLRKADIQINARKAAERALWIMRSGGIPPDGSPAPRDIVRQIKAAIAGATTSGDMAALADLQMQSEALTSTLASVGYFDALRGDAIEGERWAKYAAAISEPNAGAVTQGGAIRVSRMDFDTKTLDEQRCAAIIVLSKELLRFGTALGIIELLMRRAVARATDALVIPQLVAGAPTVTASGNESVAILHDLRRALVALPSGSDARFRVGVGVDLAKRLALMPSPQGTRAFDAMTPTGGILAGLPCSVSESLGADVIVTEGTAIVATASEVELESSEAATVEMDTAPSGSIANSASPPQPVASTLVSMFQTGSVAMKVQRAFDWAPVRAVHTVRIVGAGNLWGLEDGSPLS